MKRVAFFLLLFLIAFSAKRVAAAPPLALGDADVVPYRHWEFWLTYTYKEMEHEKSYKVPTFEVIYGLLPRLELGVEGTYIIEEAGGHTTKGLDSLVIQPKFLAMEEGKLWPAVATSFQFEVPTDEENNHLELSEKEWAAALAMQKHFGKTLAITQVKCFTDSAFVEKKWRYGIDIMHSLTENLQLVSEIYALNFAHADKRNELNFRLGFKYAFWEHAKVYFAAGRSFLAAEENRPLFESVGGLMLEF
ncbi:MAG: hypothetical protein NT096_06245 [Proteobacteria bacterium]|nr:hypothetical protein [Pseudomonadota bacterium]